MKTEESYIKKHIFVHISKCVKYLCEVVQALEQPIQLFSSSKKHLKITFPVALMTSSGLPQSLNAESCPVR